MCKRTLRAVVILETSVGKRFSTKGRNAQSLIKLIRITSGGKAQFFVEENKVTVDNGRLL